MELDLKKPLIVLVILAVAVYFLTTKYTVKDVLKYAHDHPEKSSGPALTYYVGLGLYTRSDYPPAADAFKQLLSDYTTTQYTHEGLWKLGDTYMNMRDWENARNTYQYYLERYPDGSHKVMAQRRYEEIRNR